MLAVLTPAQLSRAMFPIGDTPKSEIRAEAAERGLAVADKPDSHDICFIPSGDTRAFLGAKIGIRPGKVVDADTGAELADHEGVHGFTIGQRKGLGVEGPTIDGKPRYVTAIEPDSGNVIVGSATRLDVWGITGDRAIWTEGSAPVGPIECVVQVRAHGGMSEAVAEATEGGMDIQLRTPLAGVAKGQAAVLYRRDVLGDIVIGSATIAGTRSENT